MTSGSSKHQGRERHQEIERQAEWYRHRQGHGSYVYPEEQGDQDHRDWYRSFKNDKTTVFRPSKSKENK